MRGASQAIALVSFLVCNSFVLRMTKRNEGIVLTLNRFSYIDTIYEILIGGAKVWEMAFSYLIIMITIREPQSAGVARIFLGSRRRGS